MEIIFLPLTTLFNANYKYVDSCHNIMLTCVYSYIIIITHIGKCSFKYRSIQDNYKDLTGALPIENLLSALFTKGVIVRDQKEEIEKKLLQKDKVSYLFDQIILPALKVGHDMKYDNLITVMLSDDDTTAHHLAKKLIQGKLCMHN